MQIEKSKLLKNLLKSLELMPDDIGADEEKEGCDMPMDEMKEALLGDEAPKAKGIEVVKIKALGKPEMEGDSELETEEVEDDEMSIKNASEVLKKKKMMA